jgi:hypothetical protein
MNILAERAIIETNLVILKDELSPSNKRRAAAWSLGHIGSTDQGCRALLDVDGSFIEWCINSVINGPNYAMRGTLFHALGLIGRSQRGRRTLVKLKWDTAPLTSNSAVAIPQNHSQLFLRDINEDTEVSGESKCVEEEASSLLSLVNIRGFGPTEHEVLALISKVSGDDKLLSFVVMKIAYFSDAWSDCL